MARCASASVFVLNAERWVAAVGQPQSAAKGWYLGKIPFRAEVFAEAAADIKAAVRGLRGDARKLLILDLDDTVWGGVVGDVGWEQLQLGGHDPVGEALVDFQQGVKALTRRGVVLGIVSKNTESVAVEAIRSHPAMVLRLEDFVGWRINWQDKAANIAALAAELRLGLQSTVFIDDNPVERARVREALPEVLVPEWPEDKLAYPAALAALRCFDSPAVSREDQERGAMYAAEREREAARESVGSLDDWLATLGITVRAERVGPASITRTTQLLNKTNQMNLSTRRMTEGEVTQWAGAPGRAMWAITVSDRFGDAGLTGVLGVERQADTLRVVDFVLSCRVMGRKVEETMTHLAVAHARAEGARRVEARLIPTAKNQPCRDFWSGSGWSADESGDLYAWDTSAEYPRPAAVTLTGDV